MNHPKRITIAMVTGFLFISMASFSQINAIQLREYVQHSNSVDKEILKSFYTPLIYQAAWLQPKSADNLTAVYNDILAAPTLGLDQKAYNLGYIQAFQRGRLNLKTITDSVEAEINITLTAIHFYTDIAFGNTIPNFGYKGLSYNTPSQHIPILLAEHILNNKVALLKNSIAVNTLEVTTLGHTIKWFTTIMADSQFKEITNIPLKPSATNPSLLLKLYQLGLTDTLAIQLPDSTFKKKIKAAQQQFGLLSDGVIRSTLVQELNMPLAFRLRALNISINYYRWLNSLSRYQTLVLVNIPAAYMKVYQDGKTIIEMKLVVGKPATPTPTLSSTITEVVLYPYWHVPYSIATKEILPIVQKSPAYINKAGYQVLDSKGKIIDPSSVNWRALSAQYFPYTIRQSTGCDNALGLIKLNFYNPYDVYLHDTPMKNAFSLNKRYFSHGCMRMEKPMELAHLVLSNNSKAIDTLEQKGCLRNQSPITVPATQQIPVIVWYNPAGIDTKGHLVFYEDIYRKLH